MQRLHRKEEKASRNSCSEVGRSLLCLQREDYCELSLRNPILKPGPFSIISVIQRGEKQDQKPESGRKTSSNTMQFEFVTYNFNKAKKRESPFFSIKLSTANTQKKNPHFKLC